MSAVVTQKDLQKEPYGVLIDDTAIFNLPMLQGFLGGIKADSAKKWAVKHGIPRLPGQSWTFSGRTCRIAMEAAMENRNCDET